MSFGEKIDCNNSFVKQKKVPQSSVAKSHHRNQVAVW